MATDADPVVGNWYRHTQDKGQKFEVIAIDGDHGTVEIQHFDGDVEELDVDSWYEMEVEPIEAPENWSGPVDSFEEEELDYTETEMDEEDWEAPSSDFDDSAPGPKRRRKRRAEGLPEEEEGSDDDQGFADDDLWREEK